jgi:2,3-bisphosphoglycerate-independent phosphoglycerate mutase
MQNQNNYHGGDQLAQAVKAAYLRGQTDYYMEPLVLSDSLGNPRGTVKNGDAVIFCCRRGEREIELTEAFTAKDFPHFDREPLDLISFVILTLYHEKFLHLPVAFAPSSISNTLGELISRANMKQLRCAESEKYAHITFFLNGSSNEHFHGETGIKIPSPKGIPFEEVPGLSLPGVADEVINGIHSDYRFIATNFANGDVIGHTSSESAKIRCAEIVDQHLKRVVTAALDEDMIVVITADHGNLEVMRTETGTPHVAHTSNPVPLFVIDPFKKRSLQISDGILSDLAPTILPMLGLSPAEEMTGRNLIPGSQFGNNRRVLLIILDGWGFGKEDDTNPIFLANTPFWDMLCAKYSPGKLSASGEAVGLQPGKPGNSEAGHSNIGAGRVVLQDDVRLDKALQDGSFLTNPVFVETIKKVKTRGSDLHLIGLLTEKSSHGSIEYPLALLKMAKDNKLENVFLHLIFDGRSTAPGSAPLLLEKLGERMQSIGIGQIASGIGRGLALDRDGNYAKVQKAYEAIVNGVGHVFP